MDIVNVEYIRNIIYLLSTKSLVSYIGGNEHNSFVQLNKEEIEYPTAMCVSMSHVYVGDFKGDVIVSEVMAEKGDY